MTTEPTTLTSKEPTIAPPKKLHVLVTGASSGIGRAFFEHYSSFSPATHHVRGIDARPYPTHPSVSCCLVGSSGTFNQLDLSAETLVQKFVRSATTNVTGSRRPTSPTISYHHHHHHHQHHSDHHGQPAASLSPSPSSSSPATATTSVASTPDPTETPKPPYTGPFDLVIHSAGVRGLVPAYESRNPADVAGAETIATMDAATMRRAYDINAVATFTLIKALIPSLQESCITTTTTTTNTIASKPKVVVMTSRMGSQASNVAGGAYAYRASKAALNAVVRSFSVDVPEATFALVHPGRVETGLVRTQEEGAVEVGESVADMLALIERLGGEGEDKLKSGCFVDRWGNEIPW